MESIDELFPNSSYVSEDNTNKGLFSKNALLSVYKADWVARMKTLYKEWIAKCEDISQNSYKNQQIADQAVN